MLAPPCGSWSRAFTMWGHAIRSRDPIYGLDNLLPHRDLIRLLGNVNMLSAYNIARHAVSGNIPVVLEQPCVFLLPRRQNTNVLPRTRLFVTSISTSANLAPGGGSRHPYVVGTLFVRTSWMCAVRATKESATRQARIVQGKLQAFAIGRPSPNITREEFAMP